MVGGDGQQEIYLIKIVSGKWDSFGRANCLDFPNSVPPFQRRPPTRAPRYLGGNGQERARGVIWMNGASVPDTAHTHVMNAGLSCEASYIHQHDGCRFFVSRCGRFGDRYHDVAAVTAWRTLVERPNS